MKTEMIPEYRIDDENLEEQTIKRWLHFSISPYLDELNDDDKKIFNSLDAKEYVFTEKMRLKVLTLLSNVRIILTSRIENIVDVPENIHNFLKENYIQQLNGITEINKIFTV